MWLWIFSGYPCSIVTLVQWIKQPAWQTDRHTVLFAINITNKSVIAGSNPTLAFKFQRNKMFLPRSHIKIQYCGEHPGPKGSVLGFRPPGLEFRILCLEGSVISFILPSSGGSPDPVYHICAQGWPKTPFISLTPGGSQFGIWHNAMLSCIKATTIVSLVVTKPPAGNKPLPTLHK